MAARPLRYKPFSVGSLPPHIMVDSGRTATTVLELSHWPGNRTPGPLKADTSAEIALHFLRWQDAPGYLRRVSCASIDHYDIDGLLSLWTLIDPEAALERWDLVVETATTGDFDRFTSDHALRACLALTSVEDAAVTELARPKTTDEVSAHLFRRLLDVLPQCLDAPESMSDEWYACHAEVLRSLAEFEKGRVEVTEWRDLDLAVVVADRPVHDYATYAATDCTLVLTSWQRRHSLRYRYESFVEMVSRPTRPRVRWNGLAEELNRREEKGTWFGENLGVAHPRLELYAPTGSPQPSSIPLDTVVQLTEELLAAASTDSELLWRSELDWRYDVEAPHPPSVGREELCPNRTDIQDRSSKDCKGEYSSGSNG